MNIKTIIPTVIYYLLPCVFWGALFFSFYGIYELCYYFDASGWGLFYTIHCLIAVVMVVKFFKSLKQLYGVRVNYKRGKEFDDFLFSLKCSFGVFGEQGVGKSLTMTYIILLLCPVKFFDLQYEYYRDLPRKEFFIEEARKGNLFEWKLFKSRGESLDFYIRNIDEYIPCVYAFKEQTIRQDGRRSYELKKEHFTMSKRLPEKNMLAADEFGDRFNNSARRKDLSKKNISDEELLARVELENTFKMASTHRQVTDGFIVLADQRKGDISIAFKGTCSKKWYLVSMEERYTADFILKIKERVKGKVTKFGNLLEHPELLGKTPEKVNVKKATKKLIRWQKFDSFLSKIERKIGFFKIGYYEENGSEEVASLDKKDIKYFSMARNLNFSYNSRGYIETDPTLNLPLEK